MKETTAIPPAPQEISLPEWKNLFLQAPTAIQILRGPEFIYELANERSLQLMRKRKEEVVGRRVIDVMPETEQQGYLDLLRMVYNSGQTYIADEAPVSFNNHGKKIELWVR